MTTKTQRYACLLAIGFSLASAIPLPAAAQNTVITEEKPDVKILERARRPRATLATPIDVAEAEAQPKDECLTQHPNKESPEYQCCDAYGRSHRLGRVELLEERIEGESVVKAGGALECCLKGIVKPHADGKLTPEEDQACTCLSEPYLPFCLPCLGPQQVDDMTSCAKGLPDAPLTITKDPASGKVIFETKEMKSSANLCACPSPQSASSSFTCTSSSDLFAFFMTPVGFSCFYPEQVAFLRKNGAPIEDDPAGYRVNINLPAEICTKLGGKTQPYEGPETRRLVEAKELVKAEKTDIVAEAIALAPAAEENLADRRKLALDLEKAELPPVDEKIEAELEPDTGTGDRKPTPLRRVSDPAVKCSLLRPACLCEAPPTEPEPKPETPPVTTTPPASDRSFRIAVCRFNDGVAHMLDSGDEIAIKECPALPIKAFTSTESYNLYQVVSRYYGKPTDAHLSEVRAAILAELNSTEPAANAIITTSSMTLPAPEEGAALTALDLAAVRQEFAVKKNIEMRDDGTLKIKDAKALLTLNPGGASALTTGPEIVAPSRLFMSAAVDNTTTTNVLVVGSDAAVASGGLGGCSLVK